MVALSSQSFWQQLDYWDKWLFIKLNNSWTNSFFDGLLPYCTSILFWAPAFIFLLAFILMNYGKNGAAWCTAFVCTIALADLISSFLQLMIQRLSPCTDPAFFMHIRLLLNNCSDAYSFPSAKAAIYFGLATFGSITLYPAFKRWVYLSYIWALFISYAVVYAGAAYPLDVMAGGVLGVLAGLLAAWVLNKNSEPLSFK